MLGFLKRGATGGTSTAVVVADAASESETALDTVPLPPSSSSAAAATAAATATATYRCRCGDHVPREVTCGPDHPLFPGRKYYACDVCRYFRWSPEKFVGNKFSKLAYEELKSAQLLEKRPLMLGDGSSSSSSNSSVVGDHSSSSSSSSSSSVSGRHSSGGSSGGGRSSSSSRNRYVCQCPGEPRPLRREVCSPDHTLFPNRAFHYCDVCRYFTWDPGYTPPENVRYSMIAHDALPEEESPRKQLHQGQLLDALLPSPEGEGGGNGVRLFALTE